MNLTSRWRMPLFWAVVGVALGPAMDGMLASEPATPPVKSESSDSDTIFAQQVLPILQQHCLECHSHAAGKAKGGLMLDSLPAILAGGDSGSLLDAAQREASRLLVAVKYDSDDLQMPPDGKLTEQEIAVLETWIKSVDLTAAVKPTAKTEVTKSPLELLREKGMQHWAFQPLGAQDIRGESISEGIDRALAEARAARQIEANPRADARTLVRRLYVDLWGLPPTPEQVQAFLQDTSPHAWENLVDRLLAAPQFAERWARHWLDVARYADSNGCSIESNNTYDDAWRYRDYVINAYLRDKPYDQFVMEQVAGDLLDYVSDQQRAEQLIATGFLLLGPKAFGTSGFETFRLDSIDEQIDTVGKAFVGMAWGCARCHDHKVDPLATREYYAMAGIFASTASVKEEKGWRQSRTWNRVPLPVLDSTTAEQLRQLHAAKLQAAQDGKLKEQADAAEKGAREELARLEKEGNPEAIAAARQMVDHAVREARNAARMAKVMPIISPVPTAMAVTDAAERKEEAIRLRGTPDAKGEVVPRGLPALFGTDHPYQVGPQESGRLQLAKWLVDPQQGAGALTARVCVNRIWAHVMGRPLVVTVDNFGLTGLTPEQPQLLEWLATAFVQEGWSTKKLVRAIVLSESYRRSSAVNPMALALDPDNACVWRHTPRRLDAETLRDGLLLLSGQLDSARGGKTLQYLGLLTIDSDRIELDTPDPYRRRTIYVPILRDALDIDAASDETLDVLATFDFADPNLLRGDRATTTVPGQPLLMLNSEFIYRQAKGLAERLLMRYPNRDNATRFAELTEQIYGRPATQDEVQRAIAYLDHFAHDAESEQKADDMDPNLAAWTSLCQMTLSSVDFLFVK